MYEGFCASGFRKFLSNKTGSSQSSGPIRALTCFFKPKAPLGAGAEEVLLFHSVPDGIRFGEYTDAYEVERLGVLLQPKRKGGFLWETEHRLHVESKADPLPISSVENLAF